VIMGELPGVSGWTLRELSLLARSYLDNSLSPEENPKKADGEEAAGPGFGRVRGSLVD